MAQSQVVNSSKIVIVGMDIYFPDYPTLDSFERSVYEGKSQQETPLETHFSPDEIREKFDQVANNALQDVSISPKGNVAVILARNSQDQLINTQIANLTEVDSVFLALEMGQKLLRDREVEIVLIGGVDTQAVGAVVLQRDDTAQPSQNPIYAYLEALTLTPTPETALFHQTLKQVAIPPEAITYLEVISRQPLPTLDLQQAITPNAAPLTSGISRLPNSRITSQIASLIKTLLCLHYRYLPPLPHWQQPAQLERWQNSPFYVTPQAKPWFPEAGNPTRIAALQNLSYPFAYLILSEATTPQPRNHRYLEQAPKYLFPLPGNDAPTLLNQLQTLRSNLDNQNLSTLARQTFTDYQRQSEAPYTIALIAKTKSELQREIDRAHSGIPQAFKTGKDWQTPTGSYFTPNPQGQQGKVAYVYPSAYNAHLGLAQDLFRFFPNLFDDPVIENTCHRVANIEKLLYPRSPIPLSRRQLEALEKRLMDDPLAMLESEVGFASLITTILRDYFHLQPQAAFGYSLGEISMMHAQGVWSDIHQTSNILNTSPLLKTRLAGTKEAVREYWQLPPDTNLDDGWRTYVLITDAAKVRKAVQGENRVYLTQISTPQEVVIAGESEACQRIIKHLNCDAFRAPFNHVIHCEAMHSEMGELIRLNTLPLRTLPPITFYSAADYQPMPLNSPTIAHSLAQNLCQQLDFPRLVNRIYQDNIRVFIEVGAGSNCSRWINTILQGKNHGTISLHRRGIDDFTALLRAFAQLLSQRVPFDLSPLYSQTTPQFPPSKFTVETLGKANPNPNTDFQQELTPPLPFHPISKPHHSPLSKVHTTLITYEQESLHHTQTMMQVQIEYLKQVMISKL
jgi:PfaB family protein